MNFALQSVVSACNLTFPDIYAIVQTRARFSWQGGGVFVASGGKATLSKTYVYQNQAREVCSLFEPSATFLHRPNGKTRARFVLGRVVASTSPLEVKRH